MFCTNCGTENPDRARACICCGHTWPAADHGTAPLPRPDREYNSSGEPTALEMPAGIRGISLAGFAPFGLFALYNGMFAWGMAGLLLNALCWPAYLIYVIYIALNGRHDAWRMRRFANRADFERTMYVWNIVGIVCCLAGTIALVLIANLFSNLWASLPPVAPPASGG